MDFLDNAMVKAKEALDVACKKTNEVVSTQKQKFDVASIENKRAKDFQALGELYFEKIKNETSEDEAIRDLVLEIKLKNERLNELKEDINNAKNKRSCPSCGAVIDQAAVYCSACGKKLVLDSEEL